MNNENLKKGNPSTQFRSGREAVENGRKGGKASGVSRSFKSAVKKRLKDNPGLFDEIVDMLVEETISGKNLKALDMLLDLNGETVQRETIALKKKELKLKEEAIKPSEAETDDGFIEALKGKTEEVWNE